MADVHDRLAQVLSRLDARDHGASGERQAAILRKRAEIAAEVRAEIREPEARLVAFRAAGALFGVPLESVVAITIIRAMTPLPGVPSALAGLLNVRGRHVTAVDLGLFVLAAGENASRRLGDASKAVTLLHEGREIALISDELVGIRELFPGEIRELNSASPAAPIHQTGPEGMQIIDVGRLLEDPRLAARTSAPVAGRRK